MCVRKPHEGGGGGPGGGLDAGLSSPEDGARGFPKLVPDVSSQSSCFMMVDSPAEWAQEQSYVTKCDEILTPPGLSFLKPMRKLTKIVTVDFFRTLETNQRLVPLSGAFAQDKGKWALGHFPLPWAGCLCPALQWPWARSSLPPFLPPSSPGCVFAVWHYGLWFNCFRTILTKSVFFVLYGHGNLCSERIWFIEFLLYLNDPFFNPSHSNMWRNRAVWPLPRRGEEKSSQSTDCPWRRWVWDKNSLSEAQLTWYYVIFASGMQHRDSVFLHFTKC